MDMSEEIMRCQDYAVELRNKGYGCAQCVLMSLSDKINIEKPQAARLGAAFCSGFAGSRGICGAVSSLGIAEGLISVGCGPEDKAKIIKNTKTLYDRFSEENQNRHLCSDLKGRENARTCPDLIRLGIQIFLEAHPELDQFTNQEFECL